MPTYAEVIRGESISFNKPTLKNRPPPTWIYDYGPVYSTANYFQGPTFTIPSIKNYHYGNYSCHYVDSINAMAVKKNYIATVELKVISKYVIQQSVLFVSYFCYSE